MPGKILLFFLCLIKLSAITLLSEMWPFLGIFFFSLLAVVLSPGRTKSSHSSLHTILCQGKRTLLRIHPSRDPLIWAICLCAFFGEQKKELSLLFPLIQWFMRLCVEPYFKNLNKQRRQHSEHFHCPYCARRFSWRNHTQFFTLIILTRNDLQIVTLKATFVLYYCSQFKDMISGLMHTEGIPAWLSVTENQMVQTHSSHGQQHVQRDETPCLLRIKQRQRKKDQKIQFLSGFRMTLVFPYP